MPDLTPFLPDAILSWLSALPALTAQAADAATDPEAAVPPLLTLSDLPGILATVIVFALILAGLWWFLTRNKENPFGDDPEAESAFEKSVLREMGLEGPDRMPVLEPDAEAPPPQYAAAVPPVPAESPAPPAAPAHPAPAAAATAPVAGPAPSSASGVDHPPKDLDELVRRLQQLTVIGDLEGRVPLPVPPDGLIYRLRATKGLALLLPRMDSEAVMAHHAKRFDTVIALTHTGEVLVVSRLQSSLGDLMERPGDFDSVAAAAFRRR